MRDWWLKVERAEKHMVDIKREVMRYAGSHPYDFIPLKSPHGKDEVKYCFVITHQPEPVISLMLGDFIHNLRCALDHVVTAAVPKKHRGNASFPIIFEDIFARDENGNYVVKDSDIREHFESAIRGIHPKARAIIIQLQPYQLGDDAGSSMLGIISRLENADKHRKLITTGCAGRNMTVITTVKGSSQPIKVSKLIATDNAFFQENTTVGLNLAGLLLPEGTPIEPSNVDMKVSGTAEIKVEVTSIGGNQKVMNFPLDPFIDGAITSVRNVLTSLEFFTHND